MRRRSSCGAMCLWVLALMLWACDGCEDEGEVISPYFDPVDFEHWDPMRKPWIDAPTRVDFGDVERAEQVTRVVRVKNTGRATLNFDSWVLSDPDVFTIGFVNFVDQEIPTRLEPGDFVDVELTYNAATSDGVRGKLTITSNGSNGGVWTMDMWANIKLPCLAIRPGNTLDFELLDPGSSRVRSFVFANCSSNAETRVRVDTMSLAGTTFSFPDPPSSEFVLAPGLDQEVTLDIAFDPQEPGAHQAQFQIETNEEERNQYTLKLEGQGAPYACPKAAIVAKVPHRDEVLAAPNETLYGIPLDSVSLSSKDSSAAPGAVGIERRQWTLVSKPGDSGAALSKASHAFDNALWLDLSGDYVIELHVWDSRGIRSCVPARLEVKAIPDEDIHVQLVWDTPDDANQFDNLGTDLDLHFVNPKGGWNSRPWDCFWQNIEPNWGEVKRTDDNPSLDIDDVDGWGPENINLNNPEREVLYRVGVHYFSAHGLGESFATVRVYAGGLLVSEMKRKRLIDQQFWHALNIEWPSGRVVEVNQVLDSISL